MRVCAKRGHPWPLIHPFWPKRVHDRFRAGLRLVTWSILCDLASPGEARNESTPRFVSKSREEWGSRPLFPSGGCRLHAERSPGAQPQPDRLEPQLAVAEPDPEPGRESYTQPKPDPDRAATPRHGPVVGGAARQLPQPAGVAGGDAP